MDKYQPFAREPLKDPGFFVQTSKKDKQQTKQ
jgi:hypothetical protein